MFLIQLSNISFPNIFSLERHFMKQHYTNIWITGGASIFQQFISSHKLEYLYITEINMDLMCNHYLPPIPDYFEEAIRSNLINDEGMIYRQILLKNTRDF